MARYAGYGQRADGNWRACRGSNAETVLVGTGADARWELTGNATRCGTLVYWHDGEYCNTHAQVPERRCADCGRTSRPGVTHYNDGYRKPLPTAAWVEDRDAPAYLMDHPAPKAVKAPVIDRRQYLIVSPGVCGHCESTNLAPLEFGIDRLPESQRECPAWSDKRPMAGSGGPSNALLNKSMTDPGITWKTCASCGERLYRRFKAADSDKWRRSEDGYWNATRMPRLTLPDGGWKDAGEDFRVHYECPDPTLYAVPYEVERPWDHVIETRYRAAMVWQGATA